MIYGCSADEAAAETYDGLAALCVECVLDHGKNYASRAITREALMSSERIISIHSLVSS